MESEEIYVSVLLDEYIDLINLREFFYILKDYDIEDWDNWNEALDEFLEEAGVEDLPY